MTDGPTSGASDLVAKVLALLDSISGFTILAIAIAGAGVLTLPSPLFGIDLVPVRSGMTGAVIASAVIFSGCLVVAKVARAAHEGYATRFEKGNARPVVVISQNFSFWQGNQSPAGSVIQVHLQGILTNPNIRRGLIIGRLGLFRLTPLGIFSARECANFAIADSGPFDLHTIRPRHSVQFRVDHFHPGRYPQTQRHIWIGLRIVDQRGRRSVKFICLRHARAPI